MAAAMTIPTRLGRRASRDRPREPRRGGFYVLMAEADEAEPIAPVWSVLSCEHDLATAVDMAVLIESDLLEHRSRAFRSLVLPAESLEPRTRRRIELELEVRGDRPFVRRLRRLVALERSFAADAAPSV
jgi:hypothetical protein